MVMEIGNTKGVLYHPFNLFKFGILSLFGVILFFTPITIQTTRTIPLDHIILVIHKGAPCC